MIWPRNRCRALERFRVIAIICVIAEWLPITPLMAQCDPSVEPGCIGDNDLRGPSVSMTPDSGSYQGEPYVPAQVPMTIAITDLDVVADQTLQVKMSYASGWEIIPGWTREPSQNGTHVLVRGKIPLVNAGENTITVTVQDRFGNVGTGSVKFMLEHPDPTLPVISTDVHHSEYKDLNQSQFTVEYTFPSYRSLDTARTTSLVYRSETASPNGFVQVDARPGLTNSAGVVAMSLQVIEQATNRIVGREYFWAREPGGNKQRMGVFWSMRAKPTGAYMYWAAVRSYWADGTYKEKRVPVRVLIVSELNSRYGAGWTIGGMQRIYPVTGGHIVAEGNGVVRWFGSDSVRGCDSAQCHFVTPEGDFSKLTYERGSGTMLRTYSDGSVVAFDGRGLMTRATDRYGRSTIFEWQNTVDAQPVPVLQRIVDPMQKAITFTYSPAGYIHRVTDPAGRITTFGFLSGDLVAISGATEFSAVFASQTHLIDSYTQDGTWEVSFYRGAFSAIKAPAVMAKGVLAQPVAKFLRAEWLVTLLATQGTGLTNLAAAVATDKAIQENVDAAGHKTQVLANRYGQPLKIVDPVGKVTVFTWTKDGLPSSSTLPSGDTNVYHWNERGQLLSQRTQNALVYQASYSRTDLPYYEFSDGKAQWRSYGAHGEVLRSWHGTEDDWNKNGTVYEYDALFRPIRAAAPEGERTEWGYNGNEWGNTSIARQVLADGTVATIMADYDSAGRPQRVTNPLNQATVTSYDALNRARTITRPDGKIEKLDYTGPFLTQATDGSGKIHRFAYNALGWMESETFPDGKGRSYTYDIDGLMIKATDRRGLSAQMSYNAAHQPLTRTADNATTTFTYPDAFTRVASNAVASVTTAIYPAISKVDRMSTWFAGVPGRLYEIKNVLDGEFNPVGTDIRTYLNGALMSTSSVRRVVETGSGGTVLAITDPTGRTSRISYDRSGRQVGTHFANGVVQQNAFATDGRLLSTTFTKAAAKQQLATEYTYDLLGRLTLRLLPSMETRWSYGYDSVGRTSSFKKATLGAPLGCDPSVETCLPNWRTVRSDSYTYDDAHNRSDSGASILPGTNRYATFAGYTLEYDLEGNLTRKYKAGFEQRFTWNTFNQLTSVTTNGAVISYAYDPLGRRVRRTAAGLTAYALYDDTDLVMELDSRGDPIRSYTYLPGTDRPLSVRESAAGYEFVYYYVLEHPGHVRGLLNIFGDVTGEYQYTPFGESLPTASGDGSPQPLRFMGRELDAGTGLYYVRNRWYDPALGRFVSEDPIGLEGGINTYAYVENDPVNQRDPSGLCCEDLKEQLKYMKVIRLNPIMAMLRLSGGSYTVDIQGFDPDSLPNDEIREGGGASAKLMENLHRQAETIQCMARTIDDAVDNAYSAAGDAAKYVGLLTLGLEGYHLRIVAGLARPASIKAWSTVLGTATRAATGTVKGLGARALTGVARHPAVLAVTAVAAGAALNHACYQSTYFDNLP